MPRHRKSRPIAPVCYVINSRKVRCLFLLLFSELCFGVGSRVTTCFSLPLPTLRGAGHPGSQPFRSQLLPELPQSVRQTPPGKDEGAAVGLGHAHGAPDEPADAHVGQRTSIRRIPATAAVACDATVDYDTVAWARAVRFKRRSARQPLPFVGSAHTEARGEFRPHYPSIDLAAEAAPSLALKRCGELDWAWEYQQSQASAGRRAGVSLTALRARREIFAPSGWLLL